MADQDGDPPTIFTGLDSSLETLVVTKYQHAQIGGDLTFAPSDVAIIPTSANIPYQLRFCPSLAQKPTQSGNSEGSASGSNSKPKKNPFADPEPNLFITDVPTKNPSHFLVLNKFPIIENHFILATKTEKPQTGLLEVDDLAQSYAILGEWDDTCSDDGGDQVFAFFNSGPESGASQAHRHIRFLPVRDLKRYAPLEQDLDLEHDSVMATASDIDYGTDMEEDTPTEQSSEIGDWETLLSIVTKKETEGKKIAGIPFAYFWSQIPIEPSDEVLLKTYLDLYQRANAAMDKYLQQNPGHRRADGRPDASTSAFSYNLAMSSSAMMLCPRLKEGIMLHDADGSDAGFVALNGTFLAGTLMVKDQKLFEHLQTETSALDTVLGSIGLPPQYASEAAAGTKL